MHAPRAVSPDVDVAGDIKELAELDVASLRCVGGYGDVRQSCAARDKGEGQRTVDHPGIFACSTGECGALIGQRVSEMMGRGVLPHWRYPPHKRKEADCIEEDGALVVRSWVEKGRRGG